MSDKNPARATGRAAPALFTDCPHWGKGGQYVIDITNGRRVPVEEALAQAKTAAMEATGQPDTNRTTTKEKKRA